MAQRNTDIKTDQAFNASMESPQNEDELNVSDENDDLNFYGKETKKIKQVENKVEKMTLNSSINDQAPEYSSQYLNCVQNLQSQILSDPLLLNISIGVTAAQPAENFLADNLQQKVTTENVALINAPLTVPAETLTPNPVIEKDWHQSVSEDLRHHLVQKIVQVVFPTTDTSRLPDTRKIKFVSFAQKVEELLYKAADSKEEYFQLLAEKIYKMQNELKELEQQWKEKQQKIDSCDLACRTGNNAAAANPNSSAVEDAGDDKSRDIEQPSELEQENFQNSFGDAGDNKGKDTDPPNESEDFWEQALASGSGSLDYQISVKPKDQRAMTAKYLRRLKQCIRNYIFIIEKEERFLAYSRHRLESLIEEERTHMEELHQVHSKIRKVETIIKHFEAKQNEHLTIATNFYAEYERFVSLGDLYKNEENFKPEHNENDMKVLELRLKNLLETKHNSEFITEKLFLEVKELKENNFAIQSEKTSCNEEIISLRTELEDLSKVNLELQTKIQDISSNLTTVKSEKCHLEKQLQDANAQLSSLKEKMSVLTDEKKNAWSLLDLEKSKSAKVEHDSIENEKEEVTLHCEIEDNLMYPQKLELEELNDINKEVYVSSLTLEKTT